VVHHVPPGVVAVNIWCRSHGPLTDRIKPVHQVSTIFLENHSRNQVPICWWDIWILTGKSDVDSPDVLKSDPVSSMKPKLMKPGSSTGGVSLGNSTQTCRLKQRYRFRVLKQRYRFRVQAHQGGLGYIVLLC
jgi:hypothetical protein